MVTGDGLLTALKLLETLRRTGKTVQELSDGLFIYPQELVNVRVRDKNAVMEDEGLREVIARAEAALHGNGRILVRPSGTEPLVRVMAEAATDDICRDCVKTVTDYLEENGF